MGDSKTFGIPEAKGLIVIVGQPLEIGLPLFLIRSLAFIFIILFVLFTF